MQSLPALDELVSETLLASVLVAALAATGEANGTIAIAVIGLLHILDLPALLEVVCKEAREGCIE